METWHLEHPEFGVFDVHVGSVQQIREIVESLGHRWPTKGEGTDPFRSMAHRSKMLKPWDKDGAGEPRRDESGVLLPRPVLVTTRNKAGETTIMALYPDMDSNILGLKSRWQGDSFTVFSSPAHGQPKIRIIFSLYRDAITEVTLTKGTRQLFFTPSPGTWGAERRRQMDISPSKRVLYPLMAGMGKAGWAIAVFVGGPLVARAISWLLSLLPDFDLPDIPWPDIHIPWPHIHIPWPDIHIPWPHFSIPWPDLPPLPELPAWLVWLMEHPKMWLPIIIGLAMGILALYNAKKQPSHGHGDASHAAAPGRPAEDSGAEEEGIEKEEEH